MPLRNWDQVLYLPMLSLRPAEMRALEELPNGTKDRMLPITHLRPWVGAHKLENATRRIADAYGSRPIVIAMGEREPPNDRPVHAELQALRDPTNGFRRWCEFFRSNENYIPAIQYSPDVSEEEAQIANLFGIQRGLVVIVERPAFGAMNIIAQRVGRYTEGGKGVCFVVDFGLAGRDHLEVAARATGYIATLRQFAPAAFVALSASSFPDSFVGLSEQPIYERRLFNALSNKDRLIYSDRGSARVERQTGGGGQPAPRIDYPLLDLWDFFRSDLAGFAGYREQAEEVMGSAVWNPNLRVWGTQMIERTAAGDTSAISGPQKSTAARINLHLHRQAYHDDPEAAEDTDEDWEG